MRSKVKRSIFIVMKKITAIFILAAYLFTAPQTLSQGRPSILFDAETMAWLKDMAQPLLKSANIDPKEVNIYVINSSEINAFVTPDKNIFFYTGLILKAQSAEEVQGVLAHEIGHIKGNHYLKHLAHSNNQKTPILIGTILAAGAAALGSGEGATALISGALASSQDQALRYSRTHEKQADKIAADMLNETGFSANHLISFFAKLRTNNLLYSHTPPAWLLTHPLPKSRISAMEAHVKHEEHEKLTNKLNEAQFKRIQAKLIAFTRAGGYTLRKYAYKNTEDALYAIALSKALQGNIDESIHIALNMPVTEASRPYQYELLAQLHLDKGEYVKADEYYTKALEINPREDLLRMQKARNQITLKEYDKAIANLQNVALSLPDFSSVYKSLGVAYGKKGMLFESHLNLAKEGSLKKKPEDVELHLKLAEKYMEQGNASQHEKLAQTRKSLIVSQKG